LLTEFHYMQDSKEKETKADPDKKQTQTTMDRQNTLGRRINWTDI